MSNSSPITNILNLPEDSAFGRVLPKTKIYKHARASKKLKGIFVEQVAKIIHTSILSHKTVNLPAKGWVKEIHVFTIVLKTQSLKQDVLQAIDKAIPYPTLFILSYDDKIRYAASYKRPSDADKKKWVVSSHFESGWITERSEPQNLPVALDLQSLYQQLIMMFVPLQNRDGESMDELISRVESLQMKRREATKTEARLKKAKQFNRKVEINSQLRNLNTEINELSR